MLDGLGRLEFIAAQAIEKIPLTARQPGYTFIAAQAIEKCWSPSRSFCKTFIAAQAIEKCKTRLARLW